MKLLAGNSNLPLVKDIAAYLDLPITAASVRRFADEEIFVEILENVRGEDVFVVQSTSYPANDNLMELLICIDALHRAPAKRTNALIPLFGFPLRRGAPTPRAERVIEFVLYMGAVRRAWAKRVAAVIPYFGDARQGRKPGPRTPISAK